MAQKIPASVIAVAVLVIIATGIIVLTVLNSHDTDQPVQSDTGIQANLSAPVTTMASNPGKVVNQCDMVPVKDVNVPDIDGFTYYDTTVFTAESAGNYSSPVGKKDANITIEQADDFARKAFPQYSPDRVDMEFSNGSQYVRAWNFVLYKDNQELVLGSLYADTGDLMNYNVNNPLVIEKQGNSNPTTNDSARATAENEIRERNGEIPLQLTDSKVQDGSYFFTYSRIIDGVPCYKDGIIIAVDSETGNVTSYMKTWYVPENAVAAQTVPAISRDAAIALVEQEAEACYPGSADSFRIVSADLRWMDIYNQDKFTPEPGVIPLAWDVRFDDKTIRAQEFPVPEDGWVDAQNGTLLVLNYFHHN